MSVTLSWQDDDDMLDLDEHESIEEENSIQNQSSPLLSTSTSSSTQQSKHQRITAPEDEPIEIELKNLLQMPSDSKRE